MFEQSQYLQILLGGLSALILFIYAVENLSSQLQELASRKLNKKLGEIVKNKIVAIFLGAGSTGLIQSSSAVTVMTITLVNTGIIAFSDSLPIIFGSNIGTTVTAHLALLNSIPLASLLIILGFLFGILGKKFKILSKPIFFLGFILFSLTILTNSLLPLKDDPYVVSIISDLSNPIIAYIIGAIFTALIHSSSAISGIVIILVQTGIIPIEVAIPIMLGANLGSSITGLIASSGLNLHAKRVGYANLLFNAIGTVIAMIFLPYLIDFVGFVTSNPGLQVAFAHLFFNLFNTILFVIFLTPFKKLLSFIVKGDEKEILFKTKYVNGLSGKKPKQKFFDIENEIVHSIDNTIRIYRKAISVFYSPSKLTLMNIEKLETLNDFLDDEITDAIVNLSKYRLSPKMAHKTVVLIKISNTIEQLGDLAQDLSEVFLRMHKLGINPVGIDIERLTNIHGKFILLLQEIRKDIVTPDEKHLLRIKNREEEIYGLVREEFDIHVAKLQNVEEYDGNIFVDAVSIIELSVSKVRDIRKILLTLVREDK
jgi:phosphate:Na+ symporter